MVILGVTYFIAFVIWYSEPEAMTDFLAPPGQILVAGAMFVAGRRHCLVRGHEPVEVLRTWRLSLLS